MISFRIPIVIDPNNSICETLIPKAPLSWELNRVAVIGFISVVQVNEKEAVRRTGQGIKTIGCDQGVVRDLIDTESEQTGQQAGRGLSTLILRSTTGSQQLRRKQMPEEERIASVEDFGAVFVVEERQVVRNLADDGVSHELADLRSSHSDLAELAGVGTTLCGLDEALEDTRIRDWWERHGDGVRQSLGDLVEIQLSGEVRSLTGVTEDGANGGEEQVEVNLVQVNELEDDIESGDLGLVHIVEVLLGEVRERRVPQNDSHQHDTAEGSNGFGSLDELGHIRLAQSIARDGSGITTLVVDVPEVQLVNGGESLATTTGG
jgi:hypothetical protein